MRLCTQDAGGPTDLLKASGVPGTLRELRRESGRVHLIPKDGIKLGGNGSATGNRGNCPVALCGWNLSRQEADLEIQSSPLLLLLSDI